MRITYVLTYLLLHSTLLNAQVSFTAFPKTRQLFPRFLEGANLNKGIVKFSGTVNLFPGRTYFIKKYRYNETDDLSGNGTFVANMNLPVSGSFNFTDAITAEKVNYRYQLYYLSGGVETPQSVEAREVVAGDGYDNTGNGNPNNYIAGHIGQWGIRLAKLLVDRYDVPVAVLNGSFTGADISYFLKTNVTWEDQNNYLRMLNRADISGLKDHIRAVYWFQGESDGVFGLTGYKSNLETLYNDWKSDYSAIQRVFVLQIKAGCVDYSQQQIDQHLAIQQDQKAFAEEKFDVEMIGTNHIPNGNDNCHYWYDGGYSRIGEVASSYFRKSIAGEILPANDFSPEPIQAYLSGSNAVRMVLNQTGETFTIDPGFVGQVRLEGPGNYTVTGLAPQDNNQNKHVIVVTYTKSSPTDPAPTGITSYGLGGQTVEAIYNTKGLGLISFQNFPVQAASLPIKFGYLKAVRKNTGAVISWEVLNNDVYASYEVQISTNARSWETAGRFDAGHAAVARFDHLQSYLPANVVYFRIKGIKKDGEWEFSSVLNVSGNQDGSDFSVYPNPLEQNSVVRVRQPKAGKATLSLYNMAGKVLATRNLDLSAGEHFLPVPGVAELTPGVYMLKIINGDQVYQQKLVKNR